MNINHTYIKEQLTLHQNGKQKNTRKWIELLRDAWKKQRGNAGNSNAERYSGLQLFARERFFTHATHTKHENVINTIKLNKLYIRKSAIKHERYCQQNYIKQSLGTKDTSSDITSRASTTNKVLQEKTQIARITNLSAI